MGENKSKWSAKRSGFESGGAGERSFGRKKIRAERREGKFNLSEFRAWRLAILGSLTRARIPWRTRDDGTIEAEFPDGIRTLSPEEQREDFIRWKEKREQEATE